MTYEEFTALATDGMSPEEKQQFAALTGKDTIKSKIASLKTQTDFDAVNQRVQQLQGELEGAPDKPGTRAYAEWYRTNYPVLEAQAKTIKAFEDKYGQGSFSKVAAGESVTGLPQGGAVPSKDDIQRMVDERIQGQYGPRWADLLEGTGNIVQKHMFAGRKTPVDFKKVSELAQTKFNGNLEAAYDEWDKPEREKADVSAREAEITRRVNEEMQKRNTQQSFPSGADMTPGSLARHTKDEIEKFDKTSLSRDLAMQWNNTADVQ